jgi:hypothetical protein
MMSIQQASASLPAFRTERKEVVGDDDIRLRRFVEGDVRGFGADDIEAHGILGRADDQTAAVIGLTLDTGEGEQLPAMPLRSGEGRKWLIHGYCPGMI